MGLTNLLRNEWTIVGKRTGLDLHELGEAEQLCDQLLATLGVRQHNETTQEEEIQLKHRAFTLLRRAYTDAERAIHHLRWEQGDADSILPPLYPGRARRAGKGEGTSPENTPAPAAPVASPAPLADPASPPAPVVPGGPGGSPFIR